MTTPAVDGQAAVAGAMRERHLQAHIEAAARMLGWRLYHTRDSRGSAAGFPDLVLVRRGRLIFAELKAQRGKIDEAQRDWYRELRAHQNTLAEWAMLRLGPCERQAEVEYIFGVYTWRPLDWLDGSVEAVLR